VELLILDDWGLAPLTSQQGRDLLEIVDDRHARRSTILTSQVPVKHWHELIPDPTIADAVLDRLVHTAHRLELEGPSLRDPKSTRSQAASATSPIAAAHDAKSAKGAKK
jgi:DNA replication protein DnaC